MKLQFFILAMFCCVCASCSSEESTISGNDSEIQEAETIHTSTPEAGKQYVPDMGEKIINYAATLEGTPYKAAGRDMEGFDCSGFIYYVYKKYNIDVPHSSRHLAELGTEVDTRDARPGDLVFFKGTNPDNPEVGHVGIVTSKPGEPVKFIHASSATSSAHVKYDSLARPNYTRRFLKIKRLLPDAD
jgi:cell wall-associated NlpC family hydrolase